MAKEKTSSSDLKSFEPYDYNEPSQIDLVMMFGALFWFLVLVIFFAYNFKFHPYEKIKDMDEHYGEDILQTEDPKKMRKKRKGSTSSHSSKESMRRTPSITNVSDLERLGIAKCNTNDSSHHANSATKSTSASSATDASASTLKN